MSSGLNGTGNLAHKLATHADAYGRYIEAAHALEDQQAALDRGAEDLNRQIEADGFTIDDVLTVYNAASPPPAN